MTRRIVKALAGALPRPFALLDVGARGGLQRPWKDLAPLLRSLLVEPDPEEAARLQSFAGASVTIVPHALWSSDAEVTLNLTRSPGSSSVFEPNSTFLGQFPDAGRFAIAKRLPLQPRTLDSLATNDTLGHVDFAKLDTQGAELAILQGGESMLASGLVGLEVEVEFARMYSGQPLFADVEPFVRERLGLQLWDLRKTYWKYRAGAAYGPAKGRLVFGDALFLRPVDQLPAWFATMSPARAREKAAMLMVASLAYGYADHAFAVLDSSEALLGDDLSASLREAVRVTGRGIRPFRDGNVVLFKMLDAMARVFKPSHGGWASVGQPLGSRRQGPFWT